MTRTLTQWVTSAREFGDDLRVPFNKHWVREPFLSGLLIWAAHTRCGWERLSSGKQIMMPFKNSFETTRIGTYFSKSREFYPTSDPRHIWWTTLRTSRIQHLNTSIPHLLNSGQVEADNQFLISKRHMNPQLKDVWDFWTIPSRRVVLKFSFLKFPVARQSLEECLIHRFPAVSYWLYLTTSLFALSRRYSSALKPYRMGSCTISANSPSWTG
jgi:hypothetical protein